MGSLIRSPLARSTGDNLDTQLASGVEGSLRGLRLSPVGSDAVSRECRTEWNCRTPSWCIICVSDGLGVIEK